MNRMILSKLLNLGAVTNPRKLYNINISHLSTLKNLSRGISVAEPSKNGKGEDAMFINPLDIGVFDGVGGWRSVGVDPGIYSKQLSDGISTFMKEAHEKNEKVNLVKALDFGADSCKLKKLTGSSTACFATMDPDAKTLRTCNLGDSGTLVFRKVDDAITKIHETENTLHGFNFPRQIGNVADPKYGKAMCDTSADAVYQEFPLENGDVSVTATDENDMLEQNLDQVSSDIISLALKKADSKERTPWSDGVRVEFYPKEQNYLGGKPDDMTVIVTKYFE